MNIKNKLQTVLEDFKEDLDHQWNWLYKADVLESIGKYIIRGDYDSFDVLTEMFDAILEKSFAGVVDGKEGIYNNINYFAHCVVIRRAQKELDKYDLLYILEDKNKYDICKRFEELLYRTKTEIIENDKIQIKAISNFLTDLNN